MEEKIYCRVRVPSAPINHEKYIDVGQNLHRQRISSAPPKCYSSYKIQKRGTKFYKIYKDCHSSPDLPPNIKEESAIIRNIPGRQIKDTQSKLHLFQHSQSSTRMPPKDQNQDEPSFFPKEMLENLPCQSSHSFSNIPKHSGTVSRSKIQYLYYKANKFSHFDYIYKLTRECKLRHFGEKQHSFSSVETSPMPKDVTFKIGIVGAFTEENLRFVSKIKGKRKASKYQTVWKISPLLCFQNDLDLKSAIKFLREEGALDMILIKSASSSDELDAISDSLIIVDENKEDITRAITSCLEKPIHQMLQNWSTYLKTEGIGNHTSRAIAEIKAIRKQLVLDESKITSAASVIPCIKCKFLVPDDIRDYLFGRPDVNAFGIWSNSSFKIFVKKTTDERELKSELMKKNGHFFDNYPLDMEIGKLIENPILKQGDPILAGNDCENSPRGTLGGFVVKVNEERKKYALTCNHIFKRRNQIAYADSSDDGVGRQIGSCIFSDMSCDFAAIEINDTILDECDVTFRRDDGNDINAHLYSETLENVGIVHKIGATTGVTQGYILSSEFYNKYTVRGNRECIFLVKGTDGKFSEEGDSGSLVFSRPRSVQQNYVDILGMVYAKNRKVEGDVEIDIYNRTDKESDNQNIITEMKNTPENSQHNVTTSTSIEDDGKTGDKNNQDADECSCCYRLHTALELFKQDQGPDFDVKFKDNTLSSSPTTSLSSESDVEAV